jgi:hypothetical protein
VSGFAIARILMQERHPIALENKKWVRAQLRWLIHENELFMVINYLKAWQ